MADVIPIDLDPDGGHIVDPPIVDSLQYDRARHYWEIVVIPEDRVSPNEKELVTIPANSPDGKRIRVRMDRLSQLLGFEVDQLVHGGDGNFVFKSSSGARRELAEPHGQIDLSTRAYIELTDIAMTAQLAFAAYHAISAK